MPVSAVQNQLFQLEITDLDLVRIFKYASLLKTISQNIPSKSKAMRPVMRHVQSLLHDNRPILITGETGTGKTWMAENIHKYSIQSGGDFIKIYCGGDTEKELRKELFGKLALLEDPTQIGSAFYRANAGTIVIKNFDHNYLGLLNELQHEFIIPLLSNYSDQRHHTRFIVTLTTRPDQKLNHDKTFSGANNYWNLINLPPLRERREDIPQLIQHHLNTFSTQYPHNSRGISFKALYQFLYYSWPGNIRELKNAVEHATLVSNSMQIEVGNLPSYLHSYPRDQDETETKHTLQSLVRAERDILYTVLQVSKDYLTAAELIGITVSELNQLINRYKLNLTITETNGSEEKGLT